MQVACDGGKGGAFAASKFGCNSNNRKLIFQSQKHYLENQKKIILMFFGNAAFFLKVNLIKPYCMLCLT